MKREIRRVVAAEISREPGRNLMRTYTVVVLVAMMLLQAVLTVGAAPAESTQRVGVLLDGRMEEVSNRWVPTIRYLNQNVDGASFKLVPLSASDLNNALVRGEVEFAILPPEKFAEAQEAGKASAIATATLGGLDGKALSRVAGSILVLKDRSDLVEIASLKGKRVIAAGSHSLAGWVAPAAMIRAAGLDLEKDLPEMRFANDWATLFDALNSGMVDAAIVSNADLMAAVRAGKANATNFRVLRASGSERMDANGQMGTTEPMPLEVFAKTGFVSPEVAKKASAALFRMDANDRAAEASGRTGWASPENYAVVVAQLRGAGLAGIAGAEDAGGFDLSKAESWRDLSSWMVSLIALLAAVLVYGRMRRDRKEATEQIDAAKQDLATTQEALERSGEIRASLLSNFRKDFRTPLAALLEISRLLRTTQLSTAQVEYVNAIRETTHNLMGSIGNVTDFASLEAGTLQLERRDFDLMDVVDTALLNVYEQMGEHHAELSVQVDTNVPRWLVGDPARIRQVLQNLLHNAMKFTRSGDVLLHVNRSKEDDEKADIRFTVIDTGVGMEAKALKSVFDPYVVKKDKKSERGLGLPLCKRLVEKLGGEISAQSSPGKGSQFSFQITLGKQTQTVTLMDDDTSRLKSSRVLLIGGREIGRRITQYYLNSWGANVIYSDRFEDAVDVMKKEAERNRRFDIVLCPAFVADRNAVELVATVRDHPEFDGVPFVVIASRQECEALPQLEQLAGVLILDRPVRRGALVLKMTEAIKMQVPDRLWKDPSDYDAEEIHKLDFEFTDSNIKRGTVLVADSNSSHQRAVALVLERMGYEVETTVTGAETFEAMQHQRYDMVFLDTTLPDMDGFSVVSEIRNREPKASRTPVVGVLSQVTEGEREHCLLSGMDDCILKPLDMESIARTMRRWTRKTQKPAMPSREEGMLRHGISA